MALEYQRRKFYNLFLVLDCFITVYGFGTNVNFIPWDSLAFCKICMLQFSQFHLNIRKIRELCSIQNNFIQYSATLHRAISRYSGFPETYPSNHFTDVSLHKPTNCPLSLFPLDEFEVLEDVLLRFDILRFI